MATIELAGRRVGQEVSTGAGHLALFYTDDLGAEFVLSAYTDNNLISGDLFVETFEGSAWVPKALSTENGIRPDYFDTVELGFDGRDINAVATVLDQYARAVDDQNLDYAVFEQNSNAVIGTLLDLVGVNVDDVLPNPSGVGFLGFIARNNLIEFAYSIEGTSGNDYLRGKAQAQNFTGNIGNDTLLGGAGDDTLGGGEGDDHLDGGEGLDTAVYSGDQSGYVLELRADGMSLTDRRADGNGTDRLTGIEVLDFEVGAFGPSFNLEVFGGAPLLSAAQLASLVELYIAYFNRAPDALGLSFWGTAFAGGTTLDEMATLFVDQPETGALYPADTSNEAFATAVYTNVLGRTPDAEGVEFWVGLLNAGGLGRDQFILEVLGGAKSDLKPELGQAFVDQQNADKAYLQTKTDIGAYFAIHKGMSDVGNASTALALFDGTSASTGAAVAAIDDFYQEALDPLDGEFLMPLIGVLESPFDMMV